MPSETRSPRLAVLIDADNTSTKIVDGLFDEVARSGRPASAVFTAISRHALERMGRCALQTHDHTAAAIRLYDEKNASDINLVIDAMDLLHSGRFDGFCLVSSDSDFTRLAARIRGRWLRVREQKTPESFRRNCQRFVYTENLLPGSRTSRAPRRPTSLCSR
jgi:uncharacterized LabA/DUF88 family protein